MRDGDSRHARFTRLPPAGIKACLRPSDSSQASVLSSTASVLSISRHRHALLLLSMLLLASSVAATFEMTTSGPFLLSPSAMADIRHRARPCRRFAGHSDLSSAASSPKSASTPSSTPASYRGMRIPSLEAATLAPRSTRAGCKHPPAPPRPSRRTRATTGCVGYPSLL
jgi:hypothetical protein